MPHVTGQSSSKVAPGMICLLSGASEISDDVVCISLIGRKLRAATILGCRGLGGESNKSALAVMVPQTHEYKWMINSNYAFFS